ncbi:hypothetical protein SARC_18234, partial [Sphaeroforma arctica JP610]
IDKSQPHKTEDDYLRHLSSDSNTSSAGRDNSDQQYTHTNAHAHTHKHAHAHKHAHKHTPKQTSSGSTVSSRNTPVGGKFGRRSMKKSHKNENGMHVLSHVASVIVLLRAITHNE